MARWHSIRAEAHDLVMPLVPSELLTGDPTRVTATSHGTAPRRRAADAYPQRAVEEAAV
jgi:hypothetical protein